MNNKLCQTERTIEIIRTKYTKCNKKVMKATGKYKRDFMEDPSREADSSASNQRKGIDLPN